MKIFTNYFGIATAVLAALLALASSPAFAGTNVWQFLTGANRVAGSVGGVATVAPDTQFSCGWLSSNVVLGNANGVWDLGQSGTITLTNLASLIGGPGQTRSFTLTVVQFNDGGIYNDPATVSIPGAHCVQTSQSVLANLTTASSMGDWVANTTQWAVAANAAVSSAVVTGVVGGSLVNQVSLVSANVVVVQSPLLSLQWLGSKQVQISWPAGNTNLVLQANSNLSNPNGWSVAQATIQTAGGVNTVTINATDAMEFYRLAQP